MENNFTRLCFTNTKSYAYMASRLALSWSFANDFALWVSWIRPILTTFKKH